MSSMQNAAPASAHSICRDRQDTSSRKVTTAMPFRSFAAGYACASWVAMVRISARASVRVTPVFRRPMLWSHQLVRSSS